MLLLRQHPLESRVQLTPGGLLHRRVTPPHKLAPLGGAASRLACPESDAPGSRGNSVIMPLRFGLMTELRAARWRQETVRRRDWELSPAGQPRPAGFRRDCYSSTAASSVTRSLPPLQLPWLPRRKALRPPVWQQRHPYSAPSLPTPSSRQMRQHS